MENENFLIVFYYKFPYVLFLCVLGAESYTCGLFLMYHNPDLFKDGLMKLAFAASCFIFHFKQVVPLHSLCSSSASCSSGPPSIASS